MQFLSSLPIHASLESPVSLMKSRDFVKIQKCIFFIRITV